MLASVIDVEARLGRPVVEDELLRVEGLLEEASALVEAHLGRVFEDAPDTVRLVVSRMVARVLTAPAESMSHESSSVSAGPFAQTVKYASGGSGGSPWLTSVDRKMLRPFGRRRGGVYSVEFG